MLESRNTKTTTTTHEAKNRAEHKQKSILQLCIRRNECVHRFSCRGRRGGLIYPSIQCTREYPRRKGHTHELGLEQYQWNRKDKIYIVRERETDIVELCRDNHIPLLEGHESIK